MALWKPAAGGLQLMHRHKKERLVVLSDGSRVKVTTEGTAEDGWVQHIESDERLDAVACPKTVVYKMRKV